MDEESRAPADASREERLVHYRRWKAKGHKGCRTTLSRVENRQVIMREARKGLSIITREARETSLLIATYSNFLHEPNPPIG